MSEQSTTRRHWHHGDQSAESYGAAHHAREHGSAPLRPVPDARAAVHAHEPGAATLSCGGASGAASGGASESRPIDGTELVHQLQLSREARSFERPELREAVARLARRAREGGCPPERLIIGLKRLVHEEALATVNDWFRGVMTERVVAWAIAAYYGIDQGSEGRAGER